MLKAYKYIRRREIEKERKKQRRIEIKKRMKRERRKERMMKEHFKKKEAVQLKLVAE